MSTDKTEQEDQDNISRQIIDYYRNYSQNKQLPKYFLGTPLSYMPPIVQDEELASADETNTKTVVSTEPGPLEPKPTSPGSSKKLEWDSGADIGYGNFKSLQKSASLPIILDPKIPHELSTGKLLNKQIVSVISYPGGTQTLSSCSPEVQIISSSSSSFNKKSASTSSSSSFHNKAASSSSSSLMYLKSKIGSPDAESTPKVDLGRGEPLITPELAKNVYKKIHLCITRPTVVQCLHDNKSEVVCKSVQTSTLQSEKSSIGNQSILVVNYEKADSKTTTDRDSIISQCSSFEYQKSTTEPKNVILDIDDSMRILEKLVKSKKYDEATKKKYIKKITNRIINAKYSGDSTASSEFFVPKNPQPISKFTVKQINNEVVPEKNSSSSYQSWKENKTESEQLLEEKQRGQGDQLVKFAKKEREHQINWIKDEISHLTKLKGLLERRTTTTVYMVQSCESSSDSCTCSKSRKYVIQTEISSSSSSSSRSSSDVPSNYKLDDRNYEVKDLTAKKEEVNIRRHMVGDIEVVSDDKETNIRVKARKIDSEGRSCRCSEMGKYDTFPRSRTHKKDFDTNAGTSNTKQYSFDVPLSSHSNFSDKVREIVEKFQKIQKFACTCNCNKQKTTSEVEVLFPPKEDKGALSKPKTDNSRCQTEDCHCSNKQVQTSPELRDEKIGPDVQRNRGLPGHVKTSSHSIGGSIKERPVEHVDTGDETLEIKKGQCECGTQVQRGPELRDEKIGPDVQRNRGLPGHVKTSSHSIGGSIKGKPLQQVDAGAANGEKKCECGIQVQTSPLAGLPELVKTSSHSIGGSIKGRPLQQVDAGAADGEKKCECGIQVQTSPLAGRCECRTQTSPNEPVETCKCGTQVPTGSYVEHVVKEKNKCQYCQGTQTSPNLVETCKCNEQIQAGLQNEDEDSLKCDCFEQVRTGPGDNRGKPVDAKSTQCDCMKQVQTSAKIQDEAVGIKPPKCDCYKLVQASPYFRDESVGPKRPKCECHKNVQAGRNVMNKSIEFITCYCTRQVQTGSEVRDESVGSEHVKCDCMKQVQTSEYVKDASVGGKTLNGESNKLVQASPKMTNESIGARKTCDCACSKDVQTSSLESVETKDKNCSCTKQVQAGLGSKDQAVDCKGDCVCCSKQVQTSESVKTGSTDIKSVSSSTYSSSTEMSDGESVRSCVCCKKKNVTNKRLFALGKQLDPLCSPCFRQNRSNNFANVYRNPVHVCNCYTYVQTTTLNEIKRTINDLNYLDSYCTCNAEDGKDCVHCKCKLKNTTKGRNGIAYQVTLEEQFFGERKTKKSKRPMLEEIKIQVPVASKKRHKNKENKIKKKSENQESGETSTNGDVKALNEYLNRNRPDFVENAESRRKAVNNSRKIREEMADKNKLRFLRKLQDNLENNPKPIFSCKEMKEINRRNYKKLPEVQRKLNENRNKQLKQASRLMVDTFNRKLQENVLKGKGDLPTDIKVIDM